MPLCRCRNKHQQDGKKHVFKAFDLHKNVATRKSCLPVTICLEDKIFPQTKNAMLARKPSWVEGCNKCFNEVQPSSHFSCMTMFFRFFLCYISRGNTESIKIIGWSNIFKIQWLHRYSFNICFNYPFYRRGEVTIYCGCIYIYIHT